VTPNLAASLKIRGVTDVRLVWNGADVTVFKPYARNIGRKKLALSDSDFIIIYNGVIGGYYKLDFVIRALAKLNDQIISIKLIMIGDGPDPAFILELSKKLSLHDKVLYLGVKNDKYEIAKILSAADVGIIPGLYSRGQLPVKSFEYCACGIPVIAAVYEDSLLAAFIREYRIGVTSPPMDEEKLAKAIYRIYKDKSFREAAGKRARAVVEEKFDRTKIAEFFLKLIEAIR
jgi:glycosyltransferase involved in cell wall biosynthesis